MKAEEVTVKSHIPIGKAGSGCKGPDVSIEHYCLKLQLSPYGILDNDTLFLFDYKSRQYVLFFDPTIQM